MRHSLLAALTLLALAGCASTGQSELDPLIMFDRTGGIAGLQDHLTIWPDGKAQLTRKGNVISEFTLDAAAIEELEALFARQGFTALQGEYLPANKCCDLMTYTVNYKSTDKVRKRVVTMDTAVPKDLQPILAALNEIISTQTR